MKDDEGVEIEETKEEEQEEEEFYLDSTSTSAAFIIGTTLSGGDPDIGKNFAKFVKKIKKR